MTTHESVLRDIALKVINSHHPAPTPIGAIYTEVENIIQFDDDDLTPPTLRGQSVNEPSWRRNVRNALQHEKEACRLINCEQGLWALPSPLAPEQAIDTDESWDLIRDSALRIIESNGTFESRVRHHHYTISSIGEDFIQVERLDSIEPSKLTSRDVRRAIMWLNASGGRIGARTLNYTVAKEMAIVALHPQIEWDEDKSNIIIMKENPIPTPPDPSRFEELDNAVSLLGKEGAVKFRFHRRRERDSKLIRKFKSRYIRDNNGRAPCQVCSFEFAQALPGICDRYIEAHHCQPLAECDESGRTTRYEDIAFLCANCHRMIHHSLEGRYLSVKEMKQIRGSSLNL